MIRLPLAKKSMLVPVLIAVAVVGLLHGDAKDDAAKDPIANLIKNLGDNSFDTREEASKALITLGEKALPALHGEMATSRDLEVRRRGQKVIRAIMLGCRKSKSLGLEMAVIDAGDFRMGSPREETSRRGDELQHFVRITRPFLLGVHEVTQDEYLKVMKDTPSWFALAGGGKDKIARMTTSQFPVERVTWFDAVEFCNRLSKLDGYPPYYKVVDAKSEDNSIKSAAVAVAGGAGYRLPTEAEWEYACRAETTTPFHFGNASTGLEGNVKAVPPTGYGAAPKRPDLNRTTKVGSYKANPWGLYDMHGNAAEWCEDWYDKDYYANSPVDDPKGPPRGTHRILRGGSWLVSNGSCRAASRLFLTPAERSYYGGFRVARSP